MGQRGQERAKGGKRAKRGKRGKIGKRGKKCKRKIERERERGQRHWDLGFRKKGSWFKVVG